MPAAKRELKTLTPPEAKNQAAARKATLHLDEGLRVAADRSELGWIVVAAYESDELASDTDDRKAPV